MQYRIALCGFSESEYRAMHYSFENPDAVDTGEDTGYELVDDLDDADFAIVDADSKPAVKGIVLAGRVGHAVFVGATPPPGAPVVLARPVDPVEVLRALAGLTTSFAALAREDSMLRDFRDPDEIVLVEPPLLNDAVPMPRRPAPAAAAAPAPAPAAAAAQAPAPEAAGVDPAPPVGAPAAPAVDARDTKKAAARAAARRARLSHVHTDPGKLEQMRDVLVYDADERDAAHLRGLLELFGFRVHLARDIAQAADVLSRRPLVAAFLDIALKGGDQGDGLVLLETIHDLPRTVGHPTPVVLIVTAQLQPADRVRAALAGIDAPLIKPVSRGDVARALEDHDVVLPADARRSVS